MIVFAHRGASGYVPQNSLASAKKAVEMGAMAIEFDVQLSKDGVPVIIHDFFLDHLTVDGKGYVKDYTLEELKKFKLKNNFHENYSEENIPTLEEFLAVLPDNMLINVEIKAILSDVRELEDRVVEILKKFPQKNNIVISSFDHELLHKLHLKYPEYRIGMLTGTNTIAMSEYFKKSPVKITSVNLALELAEENLIKELKNSGFKVFIYTVNDKNIALNLKEIGVDGIFSDYPDILK